MPCLGPSVRGAAKPDKGDANCVSASTACLSDADCCDALPCTGGVCCASAQVCGTACCPDGYACVNGVCTTDVPAAAPADQAQGSAGCPDGQKRCASQCVDLSGDSNNCGACGLICPAGQECLAGECRCTPTSCTSGCCDADDACQPSTDATCGTGGVPCDSCEPMIGEACFSGACICDQIACAGLGGCCADGICQTSSDTTCGSTGGTCVDCTLAGERCCDGICAECCGTADCDAGQVCSGGVCVCEQAACAAVGGCCDTNGSCQTGGADAFCGNIGGTCLACADDTTCIAGVCCPTGTQPCNGACVDTKSDLHNCGGCGTQCPPPAQSLDCRRAVCANGTCGDEADPTKVGQACNNNNACTTNDTCSAAGYCVGTPVVCSSSGNPCYPNVCNSQTGICEQVPACRPDACHTASCNYILNPPSGGESSPICTYTPKTFGACVGEENGSQCSDGSTCCNGQCTSLTCDANNCGACGHVCQSPTPYCVNSQCTDVPPDILRGSY